MTPTWSCGSGEVGQAFGKGIREQRDRESLRIFQNSGTDPLRDRPRCNLSGEREQLEKIRQLSNVEM